MNNGIGTDADWNKVGDIVLGAERQQFGLIDRMLSWIGGRVLDPALDPSLLRENMRDSLKPTSPPILDKNGIMMTPQPPPPIDP